MTAIRSRPITSERFHLSHLFIEIVSRVTQCLNLIGGQLTLNDLSKIEIEIVSCSDISGLLQRSETVDHCLELSFDHEILVEQLLFCRQRCCSSSNA